jgi:hypothetical protein
MVEAARTSETLEKFYQTTRRYNPEDSHLSINKFIFVMVKCCVFFAVRTEFFSVILGELRLQRVKHYKEFDQSDTQWKVSVID